MAVTPSDTTPMGVDTATVPTGNMAEPFRLTPFLNNTMFNPSPWSVIDFDSLGKSSSVTTANLTPEARALLKQHQNPNTSAPSDGGMHMTERNKFESSFGNALGGSGGDAQVPEMMENNISTSSTAGAGPATVPPMERVPSSSGTAADHSVPQSPRTTASKRAGSANKKESPDGGDRKNKRREQNRKNAAKCRQRKIDRVMELSSQLEALRKENASLKASHAALVKKLAAFSE